MMSGMISRAWQTVRPHVPMIKFRKGSGRETVTESTSSGPSQTAKTSSGSQTASRPLIEDWQLPPRYRRLLLDEKEIDSINSGGAY